jgi:Nucleotidyltransferase of unknown function (DUF6036)
MRSESKVHSGPAEPWKSFLHDLDAELEGVVSLRCLGGFVLTQQYGVARSTSDIDFLSIAAASTEDNIEVLGGLGSALHKKYGLYLQHVGIATPPCDYANRLQRMFPGARWNKLQLYALDPVDLALSKLERNSDRDRDDVVRLARAGLIDSIVLERRYVNEVRPYLLSDQAWHDQTFNLWVAMLADLKSGTSNTP